MNKLRKNLFIKKSGVYHEWNMTWCWFSCVNWWKKSRKIVEYGIQALKTFGRGAIDADGKTGDGAGIT